MSVRVENLSIAYRMRSGDVCPVDDVSFSVADGEIMGLAGESGCGKSTLGNSLIFMEGRMRRLGGRVVLDGRELPISDFRAMRPLRMTRVSLVPQYAMNALTPTRRISRLTTDLLRSHGVRGNDRDKCARKPPPFAEVKPGHQVACWKVSEGWAS